MDYGDLDKMREAWNNRQDPDTCIHEWDYMILPGANGNMFVEICPICFDMRGTVERFI